MSMNMRLLALLVLVFAAIVLGDGPTLLAQQHYDVDSVFDATQRFIGRHTEPSVAISRHDSNLIVIGFNDDSLDCGIPAFVSTDAGMTWQTIRVPVPSGAKGDPFLITGDSSLIYYAMISGNGIIVARTQDGRNWQLSTEIVFGGGADKECIDVNKSVASAFYGRLHVCWQASGQIVSCYSDDRGVSWSKVITVSDLHRSNASDARVRIGIHGEVLVSYSISGVTPETDT